MSFFFFLHNCLLFECTSHNVAPTSLFHKKKMFLFVPSARNAHLWSHHSQFFILSVSTKGSNTWYTDGIKSGLREEGVLSHWIMSRRESHLLRCYTMPKWLQKSEHKSSVLHQSAHSAQTLIALFKAPYMLQNVHHLR